jgi:hypothetical protein
MERREFLRQLTLNLAAGWALCRLSWPVQARAGDSAVRLALLADAHLLSGEAGRPEALALARAVAEIRALRPAPDLVLFAGDLAHRGRPDALDLGQEILADLPAPCWAVRGEGDYGRGGAAAWSRRFGAPRFSRALAGVHLLGLDTVLHSTPRGPAFAVGLAQRQWLAAELARLDPATPLIVVSHAPLGRLFHPWQQWTADAAAVTRLLARFPKVLYLHGHVHGAGLRGQGPGISIKIPPLPPLEKGGRAANLLLGKGGWPESPPLATGDLGEFSGAWVDFKNFERLEWLTENRKPEPENHVSLPATAWPGPCAVEGTPAFRRPGSGPRGCGWTLLTLNSNKGNFTPYLWQA